MDALMASCFLVGGGVLVIGGIGIGLAIRQAQKRTIPIAGIVAKTDYDYLKVELAATRLRAKSFERTIAAQKRALSAQAQDFANALYAENVERAQRLQPLLDDLYPSGGPTRTVHVMGPPVELPPEGAEHVTSPQDEEKAAADGWVRATDGGPELPRPARVPRMSWDDVYARSVAALRAAGWKGKREEEPT